jgi:hypothetical protein
MVIAGRDPAASPALASGYGGDRTVIVFVILGHVPILLLVAQLGMLYLVAVDLHHERDLDPLVKLWWFLLVLLFNVIGFAAEKLWLLSRRRT